MNNTLSLIIKSTRKCNLRCSYCHDWRSRGTIISFETLANLIAKTLVPNKYKLVNFIWHGGEPLLLGIDFFKKALSLQEKFIQEGQYVINSIQVNGTLLNKEWCEFFKRNKFQVGVSVDGPEEIHNLNRAYASGKGSFRDVVGNLELLKEYEIPHGVLLVLNDNTRQLSAARIFEFITHDLKVSSFSFLPAVPDNIPGEKSGEISTRDYYPMDDYENFMIEIFDYWYLLDNPDIKVRELEGIVRSVLKGNPQVCTLSGNCIGSYYHIEPEGDIYHCDKYVGDKNYHLGNILIDTLENIPQKPKFLNLIANEQHNIEKLSACKYFKICNGGCPHDRYIESKYKQSFNGECCGQSKLIEHIMSRLGADIGSENMDLLGHDILK